MKRGFAVALSLVLLVGGGLQVRHGLLAVLPGIAAEGSLKATADDAAAAANELATLAGDSARTGKPPRESDPKVKALLERVFNTGVLSTHALTRADADAVTAWFPAVLKAGMIYVFAGTGHSDFAQPVDAATMEKATRNTAEFMPEMGRYLDAQLGLSGALVDVVGPTVANNPSAPGLAKMRGGLVTTLNGTLSALLTDGVTDSWRQDRLVAMNGLAARVGKFVQPDQCRELQTNTQEVVQDLQAPEIKAALQSFDRALACPKPT